MPRRRFGNRDQGGLSPTHKHALNHPLRVRILEMHLRLKSRPLSVETMVAVLTETREYKGVKAAEVNYHLNRLRDAELVPRPR
jgi:DNA-binding transcriptional ArsR family regulator